MAKAWKLKWHIAKFSRGRGSYNHRDENRGFVREELSDDSRLVRKGNDIRNCIKERRWGSGQRSP